MDSRVRGNDGKSSDNNISGLFAMTDTTPSAPATDENFLIAERRAQVKADTPDDER